MFLNNSWGMTLDIMQRTLDVLDLRRQVHADNIANAETPNFKRSFVNYEAELRRVIESRNHVIQPQARVTDPRHIPFNVERDWRDVRPRRVLDYLTNVKPNGNNVDINEENMAVLQNQMTYEALTRFISHQFNQVNLVLR